MPRRPTLAIAALLLLLVPLMSAGCSDDTQDDARDALEGAAEDANQALDTGGAVAVASALQGAIEADERADDEGPRSMAVIQENIDDLPGEPEIVGVADDDGDGVDDDGRVEVRVDDQAACLTLGDVGEDADIDDEAC